MSILVKEDYVNPVVPLWSKPDTSPLIKYILTPNASFSMNIGDTVSLQTIPIPSAYTPNDTWIYTMVMILTNITYSSPNHFGYLEFKCLYKTDQEDYVGYTSIYIQQNAGVPITNVTSSMMPLIANRGTRTSGGYNIILSVKNNTNTSVTIGNIAYTNSYFQKIAGGGLILP